MTRVSIKITGAQGQGVNSVGEMCAKGLKRTGYCLFGYREYMSLIKGGHSSYQLDIATEEIRSTEEEVDILVCFNHHGLEQNVGDVKDGGILIHQTPDWVWSAVAKKDLAKRRITVLELPTEKILETLKAKPILGNVLITSVVWSLLRQPKEGLKDLVREQFGHKKDLLELNFRCIEEGFAFRNAQKKVENIALPKPSAGWKKHLLITGSQAMGLGIVHSGCRLYAGYPMTPSSPLLTYIAEIQNETGMVIKQAEDEITAAQMMSGAMHAGTRAITATSGGGFDLMTETVSLDGIIENPSVFVLAQRPGPATGLPTWTAQGDLMLAVHAGHGEFPRCVMAASDSADSFDLMPQAFNLAEEFQIPVVVMTDKQIAEALYTQEPYTKKAVVKRGRLVSKKEELMKLRSSDRYDPSAKDGISKRWLPGSQAAGYCAQGDEHDAVGGVDETSDNARAQMEKRMRKAEALRAALPEPVLYGSKNPEVLFVGWGSTKGVMLDVLDAIAAARTGGSKGMPSVGYLHYTYLWPLKTKTFLTLATKATKRVLVEGNYQGQLGMLLAQETGIGFDGNILKYDGRPFFLNELLHAVTLELHVPKHSRS
jgi:2-oxoglutarate ferredoxin oxidoreductase subunit alpha